MSQKEGGACGVLTQKTGINIITRREVNPSLSNLTKFWSSQENKQNLQLLVRDTLCNGHFANTAIIERYVVANNEVLPPKTNSDQCRDPRILELDRGRRQQDSAVCGGAVRLKTVPESCPFIQRYRQFCVTGTLYPIPSNSGGGHLAAVWHWRKAAHASTTSGSFLIWSTIRQDSDSGTYINWR